LSFLVDDHGFEGPEIERPWDRIPAVTRVGYHRKDVTVEIVHVVGFMGENPVESRYRHKDGDSGVTGCRWEATQRTRVTSSGAPWYSRRRQSAPIWTRA